MTEKIKSLKIIHIAICSGVIFAYIFAGEISIEKLKIPKIDKDSIVFLAIPIIAFITSNVIFKSLVNKVDKKLKNEENLSIYQTASIARWAILEGLAFVILFLKPEFMIFGVLLIVYLLFLHPTEDKIKEDLN